MIFPVFAAFQPEFGTFLCRMRVYMSGVEIIEIRGISGVFWDFPGFCVSLRASGGSAHVCPEVSQARTGGSVKVRKSYFIISENVVFLCTVLIVKELMDGVVNRDFLGNLRNVTFSAEFVSCLLPSAKLFLSLCRDAAGMRGSTIIHFRFKFFVHGPGGSPGVTRASGRHGVCAGLKIRRTGFKSSGARRESNL